MEKRIKGKVIKEWRTEIRVVNQSLANRARCEHYYGIINPRFCCSFYFFLFFIHVKVILLFSF